MCLRPTHLGSGKTLLAILALKKTYSKRKNEFWLNVNKALPWPIKMLDKNLPTFAWFVTKAPRNHSRAHFWTWTAGYVHACTSDVIVKSLTP